MTDQQPRSLDGLRVIDLSRVLAGPLCAQMLGDHGAEVIKVEGPAGDETRSWGPPFVADDVSTYFAGLNRGKENICLDLRSTGGRAVLADLLATADVVIENFKAGTLAGWGFDDDRLERDYPSLIHCRITGFGVDGPMGGMPGYDAALQAYGGLMSINGEADGPPLRVGVPIVDMMTGVFGFAGILLALHERARSGRGQVVDCTLLDSAVSMLHPHSAAWFSTRADPVRAGSSHPSICPYDVFTADGQPLFICAGNDRQFRSLCDLLEVRELPDDPRFVHNPDRVQHRAQLKQILQSALTRRDAAVVCSELLARGVPCAPVNTISQVLTDPQVRHRNLVVERPDYAGVGVPITLGRTPGRAGARPAMPGADTARILARLGYSDAQIEQLIAQDVADRTQDPAT